MKKKLLIYGAGAIGRGYIPWIFNPKDFELSYVEENKKITLLLKQNKTY